MLKTCSRCGIVPYNHVCPYRVKRKNKTIANDIRKTNKWHKKSIEIRERDNYLCRICRLNLYNTIRQYNSEDISVHHIVPIEEDNTKAFDNNNLITLCSYHHELAESDEIPKEELLKIVKEDIR